MSKIAVTLKIRGGCEIDSYGKKAGKGALIQWEKSATLGVAQDQTLFVIYEDEVYDVGVPPKRFTDQTG